MSDAMKAIELMRNYPDGSYMRCPFCGCKSATHEPSCAIEVVAAALSTRSAGTRIAPPDGDNEPGELDQAYRDLMDGTLVLVRNWFTADPYCAQAEQKASQAICRAIALSGDLAAETKKPDYHDDLIDECAEVAECANPNDGRDHAECPFCSIARDIRAIKFRSSITRSAALGAPTYEEIISAFSNGQSAEKRTPHPTIGTLHAHHPSNDQIVWVVRRFLAGSRKS